MENSPLKKTIEVNLNSAADIKNERKRVKTQKEKSKRVITQTRQWNFLPDELVFENQFRIIRGIHEGGVCDADPHTKFVVQQIHKKIYGYRSQDIEKSLFSINEFVNMDVVIQKLVDCSMNCYYCKEPVSVLYEYVREPKQWTLERIDNKRGHNSDNVEIACLLCNLRRRCMHHEKYIFTKQLTIHKIS